MEIKYVSTPDAPAPGGHYSQAVVHRGLVYVSGQLPIDPHTGNKELGTIEAQTELVLKNIGEILRAASSDLSQLLQVTIYITDINLWGAVNVVYRKVLGENARPSRVVVPVAELHYGFKIEVAAVAATTTGS